MDALRWTSKSKTNLAEALAERGHRLAPNTVGRLLRDLGYSLQANRKDKEGRSPPERSAQVTYLNDQVRAFLERGQPVISVDAKKKLRHEVARCERTRRLEDRPDAGCVVSGLCSMAWPHPRRASLATAGCEALGESRRTPVPSRGHGQGADRTGESREPPLMSRYV
jgi:hypothetical protein